MNNAHAGCAGGHGHGSDNTPGDCARSERRHRGDAHRAHPPRGAPRLPARAAPRRHRQGPARPQRETHVVLLTSTPIPPSPRLPQPQAPHPLALLMSGISLLGQLLMQPESFMRPERIPYNAFMPFFKIGFITPQIKLRTKFFPATGNSCDTLNVHPIPSFPPIPPLPQPHAPHLLTLFVPERA